MQRNICLERPGWQDAIRIQGLTFSETPRPDGTTQHYWAEGVYYSFTDAETDTLAEAGKALWQMCLEAGDYMLSKPEIMRRMGIPEWADESIRRTWLEDAPSVYGRYDIRFAGDSLLSVADPSLRIPKMLEYNADTPTSIIEAAVLQWMWQVQSGEGDDQWNMLDDMLVDAWKRQMDHAAKLLGKPVEKIYFAFTASEESGEDRMNTTYLADTAQRAGYEVEVVFTEDLRFDPEQQAVYFSRDGRSAEHVQVIFKLYPWEWLIDKDDNRFADVIINDLSRPKGGTLWIEPPYKQLWSNKGLLPVLWDMFEHHPQYAQYLLPAFFDDDPRAASLKAGMHVRKPIFGREGANVEILDGTKTVIRMPGVYGEEGYVVQEYAELPGYEYDGKLFHPVIGLWMVDGDPAGIGIREGDIVTGNLSRFVPHVINRKRLTKA